MVTDHSFVPAEGREGRDGICAICDCHQEEHADSQRIHLPVVPGPTREMCLPFGCISSGSLRLLADAIEKLNVWHTKMGGDLRDRPCLRRIEAIGDRIEAHVSTGPAVGGAWFSFVLGPNGWSVIDK